MKFQSKNSPLLLLLLPSIATALTAQGTTLDARDESGAVVKPRQPTNNDVPVNIQARRSIPTKDAPVDGKDGKPHSGPFVETDGVVDTGNQELSPLKGRPHDPTIVDGKKIPESNDGVMFDKNRERPQEGTTGTEGGVSEKTQLRKAQEGKTGEKVLVQPEAPKEQPPLPDSEEQKLQTDKTKKKQSSDKDESSTDYTGLDVCHFISQSQLLGKN
jgi:hypothetical protein